MEETSQYTRRLQAITEKRKVQVEIDKKRRELEEERLKLQQLKRKSLRDQWLMDPSSPPAKEFDANSPLGKSQAYIEVLQNQLASLQSQITHLENHASELPGPEKSPPETTEATTEKQPVPDTSASNTSLDLQNETGHGNAGTAMHMKAVQENWSLSDRNDQIENFVEPNTDASSEEVGVQKNNPTFQGKALGRMGLDLGDEQEDTTHLTASEHTMIGNHGSHIDEVGYGQDLGKNKENVIEEHKQHVPNQPIQQIWQDALEIKNNTATSLASTHTEGTFDKDASVESTRSHEMAGPQTNNGYVTLLPKDEMSVMVIHPGMEAAIQAEQVMFTEDGKEVLVKSLEGYVPRSDPNRMKTGAHHVTSETLNTLKEGAHEQAFQSAHHESALRSLHGHNPNLQTSIQEDIAHLKVSIHDPISNLQESTQEQILSLHSSMQETINNLQAEVQEQRPNLQTSVQKPISHLQTSAKEHIKSLHTSIREPIESLQSSLQGQKPSVQASDQGQMSSLESSLQTPFSNLQSSVQKQTSNLQASFEQPISNIKASFQEKIPNLHASAQGQSPNLQGNIQETIFDLQASIQEPISNLQAFTQEQIPKLQDSIQEPINNLQETIHGKISNLEASIKKPISHIQTSIQEQIPSMQACIQEPIYTIQESLHGQIPILQSSIQGQIPDIEASIHNPFQNLQESIQKQTSNLQASFEEPMSNLQASFEEPMSNLQVSFEEPMSNLEASVLGQTPNLQASIQGQIPNLQESIQEHISDLQNSIQGQSQNLHESTQEPVSNLQASTEVQIKSFQAPIEEPISTRQGSLQGHSIPIPMEADLTKKAKVDSEHTFTSTQSSLNQMSPEHLPLLQEINLSEVKSPTPQNNLQQSSKLHVELTKPLINKSQEDAKYTATSSNRAQTNPQRSTVNGADGVGADRPKQKTCQCCSVM